jgi:hypothetical protein
VNAQNIVMPFGRAKLGTREYNVGLKGTPVTIDELNEIPVKSVNNATIPLGDIAHVHDGFAVQTNIVNQDGHRGVFLTVLKSGSASMLAIESAFVRLCRPSPRLFRNRWSCGPSAAVVDPIFCAGKQHRSRWPGRASNTASRLP